MAIDNTLSEALAALDTITQDYLEERFTQEEFKVRLRDLVRNTSADAPGRVTATYSGLLRRTN
jgi:hypothetical protein